MEDKLKTPEEIADREVNKKIGMEIANRVMKIKRHEAEIKKLRKEIEKIKNGELVPEESSQGQTIQVTEHGQFRRMPNDYIYKPYNPYYYRNVTATPTNRTYTSSGTNTR